MPKCKYCRKPFKRKVKRRYAGMTIEKVYCSYRCSRWDYYWRHKMPAWAVRLYRQLVWKYHWLMRIP